MGEVPTVRVDSLHAACDKWCEFPVADRPNAVAAWLKTDDSRLGDWIFMIETDYVWMRAPPPPAPTAKPQAFHFHYINPQVRRQLHACLSAPAALMRSRLTAHANAPCLARHSTRV